MMLAAMKAIELSKHLGALHGPIMSLVPTPLSRSLDHRYFVHWNSVAFDCSSRLLIFGIAGQLLSSKCISTPSTPHVVVDSLDSNQQFVCDADCRSVPQPTFALA